MRDIIVTVIGRKWIGTAILYAYTIMAFICTSKHLS